MGSIPTAFPLASSLPRGETGTVSTEKGSLQGAEVLKAKPASYFAWREMEAGWCWRFPRGNDSWIEAWGMSGSFVDGKGRRNVYITYVKTWLIWAMANGPIWLNTSTRRGEWCEMTLEGYQKLRSMGLDAVVSDSFYPAMDGGLLENFEENLYSFLIASCLLTASVTHSTNIT